MKRDWVDRFWESVDVTEDGCWNWIATVHKRGYGQFFRDYRTYRAHRVAYELTYGPIPDGMCVCHRCDNRRCIRPDHLFVGTVQENNLDRDRKGRNVNQFGERHPASKLTWAIVETIRSSNEATRVLARRYGVDPATLRDARLGRTWVRP